MGSGGAQRDRYVELWHRVGWDATRLAFLLDPDPEVARATAQRVFGRCLARFQDRRSAHLIDVWVRRDVVRLVARRSRARALRSVIRRRRAPTNQFPAGDPGLRVVLGQAIMGLPLRQRAALVLEVFEQMPRIQASDVLGCSVSGTGALLERGRHRLAQRLGDEPDPAVVRDVLARAADSVTVPETESVEIRRTARRAHIVSGVAGVCLMAGAAAATIATVSAISGEPDAQQAQVRESRGLPGDSVADLGSDVDLRFNAAPGWCPDPRRALEIDAKRGIEATRVALRVAIAILKEYTDQLDYLIETPAGAAPPGKWPAPGGAARLRVVDKGIGSLNDSLAVRCGVQVADRTWIAIIEDRDPPWDDAVAYYVIRRANGFRVWGSLGGLGE